MKKAWAYVFVLQLVFGSNMSWASLSVDNLAQEIKLKQEQLIKDEQTFITFDMAMTEFDRQSLSQLKIGKNFQSYDNFGKLENLSKEVFNFLKSLGKARRFRCSKYLKSY